MPQLGYGTWRVPGKDVVTLVEDAVRREGYRHIDCAALYGNEAHVGHALGRLLSSGEVRREDLFVTSKLWNSHHRAKLVQQACLGSLKDLKLEYLDLYLMHWPVAMVPHARAPLRKGPYLREEYVDGAVSLRETWEAMEELVRSGLVRSIGVSNFTVRRLEEVLSFASIRPTVNQIEMHPYLLQCDLLRFCQEHGIAVTAYSPLGQGRELLADEAVTAVAERRGRTPAQVVLRWAVEHGAVVIPRTGKQQHLRLNADIFSFGLEPEDMSVLDALHLSHPRRYMRGWVRDQWL